MRSSPTSQGSRTRWRFSHRPCSEYKVRVLQERQSQIDWQCTPNDFLSDYKKFRMKIRALLDNSANPNLKGINIDSVAADLDMSRAWFMYRCLTRVLSPTSAEAVLAFSWVSRIRTKSRRRLHIHLSACVRVAGICVGEGSH